MTSKTHPTRRTVLEAAAATAGAGVLAGCITGGDPGGDDDGPTGPYSVTMEPVGTVEFDSIPETWVPYTGDYADMGVALGQADGLAGIGLRARFGTTTTARFPASRST